MTTMPLGTFIRLLNYPKLFIAPVKASHAECIMMG